MKSDSQGSVLLRSLSGHCCNVVTMCFVGHCYCTCVMCSFTNKPTEASVHLFVRRALGERM
jgi:hypothetical protein